MRGSYKQSDGIVQPSNIPKMVKQQFAQNSNKNLNNIIPVSIQQNYQAQHINNNKSATTLFQIQSPSQIKKNPIQQNYYTMSSPQSINQTPVAQYAILKNQRFPSPDQAQFKTERSLRIQTQPSKTQGKEDQIIFIDSSSPQRFILNQNNSYQQFNSNSSLGRGASAFNGIQFSPPRFVVQQPQNVVMQPIQNTITARQNFQQQNQYQNQNIIKGQFKQIPKQEVQQKQVIQLKQDIQQKPEINPKQNKMSQQETESKLNLMDQKMNLLVSEINTLQILVVKKNKEAKYWKQKFEAIDQNMASFLSVNQQQIQKYINLFLKKQDDERHNSAQKRQRNTHQEAMMEEIKELDNSEEYTKRDSYISQLKIKIKDLEQQLFDKDIFYKEQLDSITNIIKQKDDYLQSYINLNQELLDKIETLSTQQSQHQQLKDDNEQLFSDLQQKQEIINRLSKKLNIEEKSFLQNSHSKDLTDDNKDTIEKLNCQINLLNSDVYILQSQIKSLTAENQHLSARISTLLFAQNKGSIISYESPSGSERNNSDRNSDIKKIQKQMQQYAQIVNELQDEGSPTGKIQTSNQFEKTSINDIQSTQRDSGRQQQSFLSSEYTGATHRQYDINFLNTDLNNKQFTNSKTNNPNNHILMKEVL